MSHTSQPAATDKQAALNILPPFSGKLKVDKKLKLGNNYFKQTIEKLYENEQLSAINQLKATPYPTPHVLAQFASKAYDDNQHADPQPPACWKLLTTASNRRNGYFGTAYLHPNNQQVVIAHRGTNSFGAVVTDVEGVLRKKYTNQMRSASTFANKVVTVLQAIEQEKNVIFEVFFTGHSLGGWLAQITTFTTEYLEDKGGIFLKKVIRGKHEPLASSTVQESHEVQECSLPRNTALNTKTFKLNTGTSPQEIRRGEHETLAGSSVQESHEVQECSLPRNTALNTKTFKLNTGTSPQEIRRGEHETLAGSSVQESHEVQECSLPRNTALNTKTFKLNTGTSPQEIRRGEHEPLASSSVQDSHGVQEGRRSWTTAFFTKIFKRNTDIPLKEMKKGECEPPASNTVPDSYDVRQSYHPHTVVFDSPGCKDMLSKMANKLDVRLLGRSIVSEHLDITSYLSAPNLINTRNSHLGTVYRIFFDLSDMDWKENHTLWYNRATHSMDKILKAFDPETGQVRKDDEGRLKIREVVDWPLSAGLTGGAELKDFFTRAEHLNEYDPKENNNSHSKVHKDHHRFRYQVIPYDERSNSLSVFTQDELEFLKDYLAFLQLRILFKFQNFFFLKINPEAGKEAEHMLQNFELVDERICCSDASTLHALIPYVKRLIRLFPRIKKEIKDKYLTSEIINTGCRDETLHNVEKIHLKAHDFNPSALGLGEFLDSDQQIGQLRIFDRDAWTGITEVYWVLQNTTCTSNYKSDSHFTILDFKWLLTINRVINLNALMASMKTPHLLMIACEENQPFNNELRVMLNEMFSILSQKNNMKIILTKQSNDDTAASLQQMARDSLGEGFITTDDQLTWSDLTDSSKEQILKNTVIFQGSRIVLNQLISAESMTDSFPLADLLQEKELKIGKEIVPSACSGYNEKYYVDRTFNHNIFIRQDIFSEKEQRKFDDLLASSKEEFLQVCGQNKTSNVHWLVKEESGELLWQNSQGNLKTLYKYIDAQKSQTYAPSDLDKLLEQAKNQRVMIISDKAGMGKTTVLTHLHKQIKQKFPEHWLVRIDLNKYEGHFNALDEEEIDKEDVLKFVSSEVLKLKSNLEKELFKKSFEGKEISKIVVMVDGFDEISPNYNKTVLDMLKILKQASLEHLWVTTRPHLREYLEDNLRQLSYSLQPFSEVEQVEFLRKFLPENLNLGVTNKDTFVTALIRKFAQSISDKDKEFTGIPLQIRMLAENFEKNFRSFYQSEKSEHELPHKLKLLTLFSGFIDTKYNIYNEEKSEEPTSNIPVKEQRKRYAENIPLEHQKLALKALFSEDEVSFLQIYDDSTFADEELTRIGIVQRNNEGKLQFIHLTFAEYYVSEYLIKRLTKKTKQHPQEQDFLLNIVLLRSDCQVIRTFLDGLLENSKPSNEALEEYGEKLDKSQALGDCTTAIQTAAAEDNAHIIAFVLDSLFSGNRLREIRNLLLAGDPCGQTAWHQAAHNGSVQALQTIWEWAKKVTTWQVEAEIYHEDGLRYPLENIMFKAKDECGNTALHAAAQGGSLEVLEALWSRANDAQIELDELLLAQNTDRNTAWQIAAQAGHLKLLQKLGVWAKEVKLNETEVKNKLLLAEDQYGYTVWYRAAESGSVEALETVWILGNELKLKPDEMFLAKVKDGNTAWQVAVQKGHFGVLEKLWEWNNSEQMDGNVLKKELLLATDQCGYTAWHRAAQMGNLKVLETLWSWAKEADIDTNELKKHLFLAVDKQKETVWHLAADRQHFEVLEKMWVWAREAQKNPNDLMKELLLARDQHGYSVRHRVAQNGSLRALKTLWC